MALALQKKVHGDMFTVHGAVIIVGWIMNGSQKPYRHAVKIKRKVKKISADTALGLCVYASTKCKIFMQRKGNLLKKVINIVTPRVAATERSNIVFVFRCHYGEQYSRFFILIRGT